LDNGFWGDSGMFNLPELVGGIAFDADISDPMKSVKHGPFPLDRMQQNSYY